MSQDTTVFLDTYGDTLRNRVLQEFLISQHTDVAVSDTAREAGISRPKAYEFVKELEEKGIVRKSRIVSHTQLYRLNPESPMAKLLLQSFNTCLRITMEDYLREHPESSSHAKYSSKPKAAYVRDK